MKKALITGVTGQDGHYLTDLLNGLGYEVHGTVRPSTAVHSGEYIPHTCDITDAYSVRRLIDKIAPDEVYNLAAQSHVGRSFENPALTLQVNAGGALNILEALRGGNARFYQASTSEMFGSEPGPQNEDTRFHPRSPYGVAKLAAHWFTINYREAYGLHASTGILFNHESPIRGRDFVTRKITRAVAAGEKLILGNLDAKRDWGHAEDYVRAMHAIVQHEKAGDYVIATGTQRTVREFVEAAYAAVGQSINWKGRGLQERGFDQNRQCVVEVSPEFFRPSEVQNLCGDASKARAVLNWDHAISFEHLVAEMVHSDIEAEA
jgi:GDPmannose 4,6-dehydratase